MIDEIFFFHSPNNYTLLNIPLDHVITFPVILLHCLDCCGRKIVRRSDVENELVLQAKNS